MAMPFENVTIVKSVPMLRRETPLASENRTSETCHRNDNRFIRVC